jgi:hypothetical protein
MRLEASFVLLAACGLWDDSGVHALGSEDGGGGPEAGLVEVIVFDVDTEWMPQLVYPAYHATVDFVAPDQTRQTVLTDEVGIARAVVEPGATVISYGGTYTEPTARVFLAVRPGDSIIVNRRRTESFVAYCVGVCPNDITFELPRAGGPYIVYEARVSCSRDTGTTRVNVEKCPNANAATVVGWARDNRTGQVVSGATVLRNLDLASLLGTTVQMPKYESSPTRLTADFHDFPAGSSAALWDTEQFFTGDSKRFTWARMTPTLDGANEIDIAAAGDRTQFALRLTPPNASEVLLQELAVGRASSFAVTGNDMIRPIRAPQFDVGTQTVSWQNESYGRAATLARATIIGRPAAGQYGVRVIAYAPGNTSGIVLPVLPAAYTPVSAQTVAVELTTIEGENYNDSLEQASSRSSGRADFWEPDFVGRVWTTTTTIGE